MIILREGDQGPKVTELQRLLVRNGVAVFVDGIYGPATKAAVQAVQHKARLVVDGIYGPKTKAALQQESLSVFLQHKDIEDAAKQLGVSVAAVMAVNSVESLGRGFLADGRPVILFERHIFRRLLSEHHDKKELAEIEAKNSHIVNTKPGGYQGGANEWQRMAAARIIHESAALQSASWGLFQIMGFHFERLGFDSVAHFVEAMSKNEAEQLRAFVTFIKTDKALHKALKARKWTEFAKRYNGPAYAQNLYDVKLARAFKEFSALYPEKAAA